MSTEKLVATIMNDGFKHHYALVHADIAAELRELCRWSNIRAVVVE